MKPAIWEEALETLRLVPQHVWLIGGIAVAGLLVLVLAYRVIVGRRRAIEESVAELALDVGSLGTDGPPPGLPVLELYNLPVRLAAVVLAPAGRAGVLPPAEHVPRVLDALLPGLGKVADMHQPRIRLWPAQLSTTGFAHSFFQHARLPGNAGRNTPLSAVAGPFRRGDQPLVAGLVLCAAAPNSLGQIAVDMHEKWLGCLRVRMRD
jgi:hypothetical protein